MIYRRLFNLSVAHFNSGATYAALQTARSTGDPAAYEAVLADIHGHNLVVSVTASGDLYSWSDFLIDDDAVSGIVSAWDNRNLSVHPDFIGIRATTERMADVLASKLKGMVPTITWTVRIHENELIYSEATR